MVKVWQGTYRRRKAMVTEAGGHRRYEELYFLEKQNTMAMVATMNWKSMKSDSGDHIRVYFLVRDNDLY